MMRQATVREAAPDLTTTPHQFDIIVDGEQILDGEFFIDDVIQSYYDWCYMYYDKTGTASAYDGFKALWISFIGRNIDSLKAMHNTLLISYDPISTYSRDIVTAFKNSRDVIHGKTTTTTPNTTTTTTYGGGRTDSVTTFDSASYRPEGQTQNSGTDTQSQTGSVTNTDSGTDTTTDTRLAADNRVTETGRQGGSISADIDAELTLRIKNDFADLVMLMFANDYFYLRPGDD